MRRITIALGLVLLAACTDRTPPEPEQQSIRPAKLMTVGSVSNEVVYEFTARIEAYQSIDLSFEVGGPLDQLIVREGETIEKGALIAALDPTDFQLAVREAEVQLKLAAQDLNRKRKVLKENGIAKSIVEDAESQYQLQSVRLRRAKERLEDTRIHAPFEAYVSQRYQDTHVNVGPGTPIVRLHDLNQLLVVISTPESLFATVTPDQVTRLWAEFSFAPGQEFEMLYHENRGEADALAQTYEVSFTMSKPEGLNVLPGMSAAAKIRVRGSEEGSIMIPASSLVSGSDNSLFVWVFDPESQLVSRRPIKTGAPTQTGVPITGGLKNGEQIVIAGASQLQEGMQVRPFNE
jgi:RND family efflux transporter MFP subunit